VQVGNFVFTRTELLENANILAGTPNGIDGNIELDLPG
jgi:hypothetical protein